LPPCTIILAMPLENMILLAFKAIISFSEGILKD
jgi:hypothetical protein